MTADRYNIFLILIFFSAAKIQFIFEISHFDKYKNHNNKTIMTKTLLICSAAFTICFAFPKIAFAAFAAVALLIVLAALGIVKITFTSIDKVD